MYPINTWFKNTKRDAEDRKVTVLNLFTYSSNIYGGAFRTCTGMDKINLGTPFVQFRKIIGTWVAL